MLVLGVLSIQQYRISDRFIASQQATEQAALQSATQGIRADLGAFAERLFEEVDAPGARKAISHAWLNDLLQRFPALESGFLVLPRPGNTELRRLDTPGEPVVAWPDSLADWRHRVESEMRRVEQHSDGSTTLVQRGGLEFLSTAGLAIPVFGLEAGTGAVDLGYVLLIVNRERLATTLLAPAVQAHFNTLLQEYAVVIEAVDFEAGHPWPGDALPDLSRQLDWPSTRTYRRLADGSVVVQTEVASGMEAPTALDRKLEEGGRVEVVHRNGSLAKALAARQRLQTGMLIGIVGLALVLLVVLVTASRNMRALAEQQMAFVAGVSHEFRTPVASIRALAENLSAGVVWKSATVREYGELIVQEAARLGDMTEQVLDYAASKDSPTYARNPVPLNVLLDRLVGGVRAELEIRARASDLVVDGDEQALTVAFRNLLVNARKHGHTGGRVGARVDADSDHVFVEIWDDGPGIPAEERSRVFEPFWRGASARDRQVPGNGLGLSLVHRVITGHGGSVRIADRPGGGVRFVVDLPRRP